jgi:hypothetical protein
MKNNMTAFLHTPPKRVKEDICLSLDSRLLAEARLIFAGQLSKLFEAALRDALEIKRTNELGNDNGQG